MKAQDLFLAGLQAHILPLLQQSGFKFRRSKLDFTRTASSGIRQQISLSLSRWNAEDQCDFWSMWGTSAPEYVEWLRREWNEAAGSDDLAGLADWNIPGWSRPADRHFELRNRPSDELEWREFLDNVQESGLPFLERISSWRGAAEQLRGERWQFDRAADFLLIAGEPERARATLLEGIRTFETDRRVDNLGELPRLKRRLERYFPGSVA